MFSTDPEHSPIPATMKKTNSTPAKTSTVYYLVILDSKRLYFYLWRKERIFKKDCSAHNHYSVGQRKQGREKGGLGRGYSKHHQKWRTVIWSNSFNPAGDEGPPMHSRNGYLRLQKSYISSSFFLRNKTPFLVFIVSCSELSNWYNCGQSRYCLVCVCVCVCVYAMSGSSGRQPGILFLNFGSCCIAPHIMAPLLKAG